MHVVTRYLKGFVTKVQRFSNGSRYVPFIRDLRVVLRDFACNKSVSCRETLSTRSRGNEGEREKISRTRGREKERRKRKKKGNRDESSRGVGSSFHDKSSVFVLRDLTLHFSLEARRHEQADTLCIKC